MDLALFGAIVSFVNLGMTALTSLLFARSRKLATDSARLKKLEPKYLEALEYIYAVRAWNAARGNLKQPGYPKPPDEIYDEHIPDPNEQTRYEEFLKWKSEVEGRGPA